MEAELTAADAEYLQEYVSICERFIRAGISKREANRLLEELNAKSKVSIRVKKTKIISPSGIYVVDKEDYPEEDWDATDSWEADGWMPSSIC